MGSLVSLGDLHTWIGLKESDDQGTRFDLRVEVFKNGTLVSSGETYAITGVTRNPDLAKEVTVSNASFAPVPFASPDVLSLKVLTRIGTDGTGKFSGGHSNAVGLRMFFDATSRSAKFAATFSVAQVQLSKGPSLNNGDSETISGDARAVRTFALGQNYPNPFNPTTHITFDLPKAGAVSLVVRNVLGQEVTRLVDGYQNAGRYTVTFVADRLAAGIYYYVLNAGEFRSLKKKWCC